MPAVRWQANGQVTLDANGNGTVIIAGPKPGQRIDLTLTNIIVTNSQRMSAFNYYKNTVNDYNLISGSATGNRDTDSQPNVSLFPGEFVTAVWSGGDTGAIASIFLTGVLQYGFSEH